MQRLKVAVLLLLAVGTTACSSRNPSAPDGGTGFGKSGGGNQPSPGTGSGGGGDGGSQPSPAPAGRHNLSWDGSTLRLRLAASSFTAWRDGGGETTVDLNQGWTGQYVPFNASGARASGIAMARDGSVLSLAKDGAAGWVGPFNVVAGDKFNVKFVSSGGNAWLKYETTDLSGIEKELDAGATSSYHFKIPAGGII